MDDDKPRATIDIAFGDLVWAKRGRRSLAQVSADCDIDPRRLAQIESGERSCTLVEVACLKKVLGLTWPSIEAILQAAPQIEFIAPADTILAIDVISARLVAEHRLRDILDRASGVQTDFASLIRHLEEVLHAASWSALPPYPDPHDPDPNAPEEGQTPPATPPDTPETEAP